MRILLLGDYSNVHATLADGLRQLGHTVVVASDGDGWKNYPRDVDLARPSVARWQSLLWWMRMRREFHRFRGYDVVQIINPVFLPLRAERLWPYYAFLRRHNRHVFLGAFGMDHYFVKASLDCTTYRYGDFQIGKQLRHSQENDIFIADWLDGPKGVLNRRIAADCDGIIAGLWEYHAAYAHEWADKMQFIPFPIRVADEQVAPATRAAFRRLEEDPEAPVRFFIGIQRSRSAYKGTDIMLRALEKVCARYPRHAEMVRVESVPFDQYIQLMQGCHVILDQLYSYTPAMNALEAMARGLVVVGGGEPENYDIRHESELRPIINVQPNEEDCVRQLSRLVENRHDLPALHRQTLAYIRRHHDHLRVAAQYVAAWQKFGDR